jgi:hypothetical protein
MPGPRQLGDRGCFRKQFQQQMLRCREDWAELAATETE